MKLLCWGCNCDQYELTDLVPVTSFVTGNETVMVCLDCLKEIKLIEEEVGNELN